MGGLFIGRSSHGEHERRAALILDGMYQFVALLNPEGHILEVNRAALEGAGHRIEEIRGKPFWTARWWQVSGKIREELKAAIRQAADGEFVRYEVQIYGEKAGLISITIDFSLQPIGSESGEVEYLLAEGRNITERKQAEETLPRTETELRDLIENMPAIAGVLLPDGSHPYLTNRWQEYTGLSVAETDSEGWRRVVHPEDVDLYAEKSRAAATARKPFENELRLRRAADGEYRWFLVRISPLCDGRGNIVKWHGVMTDIEDRKRAEQALKRSEAYLAEAQELTRTGSWARDPHSEHLVYCSDETYRIFGLDKAEGIPSIETFIQRVHPDVAFICQNLVEYFDVGLIADFC
jgi:PAS domain S-box-containing protein